MEDWIVELPKNVSEGFDMDDVRKDTANFDVAETYPNVIKVTDTSVMERYAKKHVVLVAGGQILKDYFGPDFDINDLGPDPIQYDEACVAGGDCKNDHGERTNYKLRDQPFYARGRNGKMKRF